MTVKIDKDLAERVRRFCENNGISATRFVNGAIEAHLIED